MPLPVEREPWWREYSNPAIRAMMDEIVARKGPNLLVTTPKGSWYVPRHYLALWGLESDRLPGLAMLYEWEQVGGKFSA